MKDMTMGSTIRLGGRKFIVFEYGSLAVYSSFTKKMGTRIMVVDCKIVMFIHIRVLFRGIFVWDEDPTP